MLVVMRWRFDRSRGMDAAAWSLVVALASCGDPAASGAGSDAESKKDASVDDAKSDAPTVCVPVTCATMEAECGAIPDGCGGKVACGVCEAGAQCGGAGPNRCGSGTCTPLTCADLGAACGYVSDGCSDAIECGACPPPLSCGGAGTANQCGCKALTCAQLGAECGILPDGCTGVIDCGGCQTGKVCGGGGPNRCGTNACTPKTCSQLGASCGYVSDQCNMAVNCGQCPPGGVCGGGGVQNQCSCTCALPHAIAQCQSGTCAVAACDPGYSNCDGADGNGCEAKLSNDEKNCGSCGNVCPADGGNPKCDQGKCAVGDCHGPEHCGGATPVCCAKLVFGAGTLPNCAIESAVSACAADCAFLLPSSCPGTGEATFCHASAECATDSKGKKCCSFQTDTPQPFCVNDLVAAFATACY